MRADALEVCDHGRPKRPGSSASRWSSAPPGHDRRVRAAMRADALEVCDHGRPKRPGSSASRW